MSTYEFRGPPCALCIIAIMRTVHKTVWRHVGLHVYPDGATFTSELSDDIATRSPNWASCKRW